MTWARFDDRYDDAKKVRRAWRRDPRAIGLHAMAITHCCRHETDGVIELDWIEGRIPRDRDREKVLTVLLDVGLFDVLTRGEQRQLVDHRGTEVTVGPFDEDVYVVHDFLDYNDSSASTEEKRSRDADRKRRARGDGPPLDKPPKSGRSPNGLDTESAGSHASQIAESASPVPSRPVPSVEESSLRSDSAEPARLDDARNRLKEGAIRQVFDAWVQATDRTGRTVLTDARRKLAARRLKEGYPVEDLVDATRGWRHSAHHRGENETGTVYNDFELLLRSGANVEKFRDLERAANAKAASSSKPLPPVPPELQGSESDIRSFRSLVVQGMTPEEAVAHIKRHQPAKEGVA